MTDAPVVIFDEMPRGNLLTFSENGKAVVTINLETGEVTLARPPDDAARAFWNAVQTRLPTCPPAEDDESKKGLKVIFADQSVSFVHRGTKGFIQALMRPGVTGDLESLTPADDREVIRRMAVAYGWTVEVKADGSRWDMTKLTKDRATPEPPIPSPFRVIDLNYPRRVEKDR